MLSNVDDLTASRYTRDMYQYSFLRSHAGKQQATTPQKLSATSSLHPITRHTATAPPLLPLTPPPSSLPSLSPTLPPSLPSLMHAAPPSSSPGGGLPPDLVYAEDEEEDAAFLSRIAESARGLNGCGGIHEVIAHLQVRGPVQLEYSNDPHRDDNRYTVLHPPPQKNAFVLATSVALDYNDFGCHCDEAAFYSLLAPPPPPPTLLVVTDDVNATNTTNATVLLTSAFVNASNITNATVAEEMRPCLPGNSTCSSFAGRLPRDVICLNGTSLIDDDAVGLLAANLTTNATNTSLLLLNTTNTTIGNLTNATVNITYPPPRSYRRHLCPSAYLIAMNLHRRWKRRWRRWW